MTLIGTFYDELYHLDYSLRQIHLNQSYQFLSWKDKELHCHYSYLLHNFIKVFSTEKNGFNTWFRKPIPLTE